MVERTFVILKPSCVSRGLIGEVIARLERKGLRLVQAKMRNISQEEARRLYKVHEGKPFFNDLIRVITSGRVMLMVWEGRSAVEVVRRLIGATDPVKAEPGTIRGDYGLDITDNLIHASDSTESYEYEHAIFFAREELES
ncbi:MAG: nucleoside-diphosphate kinase [Aigarchaeota archaeon]|nr:nucleoside-diphosphate kinase [Candidatus Pelearchaeum maunauluense]